MPAGRGERLLKALQLLACAVINGLQLHFTLRVTAVSLRRRLPGCAKTGWETA